MQYGFFDNENREYVITRPDTPTPWINYLGNGGFGGIISNNAGGLAFDGDPGKRRLTRYRYNNLPMDRPGRYVYIKDMENGDMWSPTWQPVLKKLDFYECRHGLSYTTIKSEYSSVSFSATYFVPQGEKFELWRCKILNKGNIKRSLKLFPYVEFSWFDTTIDTLAEWARYGMCASFKDNIITYTPASEEFIAKKFLGYFSTDLKIESFECARDKFIGLYRSEQNPVAVENGICQNSNIDGDHACAAFSCPVELQPGDGLEFTVVLGAADSRELIGENVAKALDINFTDGKFTELKKYWDSYTGHCQVDTPDADVNKMINIWHSYQCRTTFDWSRFISYYERGSGRGWGFRDSMQDVLGVMHAIPKLAKERIKTLLSIQQSNGNAKSVYFPGTGESEGGGRSDDHLWSVYSVCIYIKESGDYEFLNELVPYVDGGYGSVLEHLIRGLEFTRENLGRHGIPLFLRTDWNDSVASIGRGESGKGAESVFVFFQAAAAANYLCELFLHLEDHEHYKWAKEYYEQCREKYPELWDGKWFIRAYTGGGEKYGTDSDEFNKIFLNPQSWAVLSKLPTQEESNTAFDNVEKYLLTKYGLISHYPASSGWNPKEKTFFSMHKGLKENGGVFCHANTWAVIAEAMLKRADAAFKIYKASLPCNRETEAEKCLIEPYVYGSAQIGPAHERFGNCSNSWLTGTASWMYYAFTQYILGFRPEYDGIIIDPCIPSEWDGFKMSRIYRGIKCRLSVTKGDTKALTVNGKQIDGNFIPYEMIKDMDELEISLG